MQKAKVSVKPLVDRLARLETQSSVAPSKSKNDCILHVLRGGLILKELHGLISPPLGQGAQIADVAEEFRERCFCAKRLTIAPHLHAPDLPTTSIDVPDHRSEILLGDDAGQLHNRLEEDGRCLLAGRLEGHARRDLKSDLAGVDFVEGSP